MTDEKKFLDQSGVEYLWSQLSLEDYPNNETLIAVLNAIDTTKADKTYADSQDAATLESANAYADDALETIAAGKASQVDLDNIDARVNELSANVGYINIDNNEDVEEAKENILPTVSNADNGKILAVVNGIWTAVSLINSEEVSY